MKPQLEILEARCVPSAAPTYHGGLVQQDPAIATLVAGVPPPNFNALINTVVNNYLATDLGAFGVRSASWNGNAQVSDPGPLSDAQVQQLIVQGINNQTLPQPLSANQQYLVLLNHPVTDMPGAGAYHSYFYDGSQLVIYEVVWPSASGSTLGYFHEPAEAATDPTMQGWYYQTYNGGEVADLGGGGFPLDGFQAAILVGPNGQNITGPTAYVPLSTTTTTPTTTPTATTTTQGIFAGVLSFWEQEISALFSLFESPLLREALFWSELTSGGGF